MATSRTQGEGASSGALTLIEKKEFAVAATTTTFSGLDGNADGIYILEAYLLSGLAGNTAWNINPNGLTTNQLTTRLDFAAAYARTNPYGRMAIGFNNAASGQFGISTTKIWARAAGPGAALDRMWHSEFTWQVGAENQVYKFIGAWQDSVTNITSIEIEASQANGIGVGMTLALYKLDI